MSSTRKKKLLEAERDRLNAKYGDKAASTGRGGIMSKLDIVPFPSLTMDYKSGVGGAPLGHAIELYGSPSIGKSLFGYRLLANAQKLDYTVGIICVEPDWDEDWVERNGIDLDAAIVTFPDNGEEAFEILREWVFSGVVDYILFDSVGGLVSESAVKEDGKAKVGGESLLITWGIKRVLMRARKNNVGIAFINQQRDDLKNTAPSPGMVLVDSPGGWAFKHAMKMRIHVKPGKERFITKVDDDKLLIGREIVVSFKKAKTHNALGKTARFNWFWVEADGHKLGVDLASDVINVGKLTGVLSGSSWIYHEKFPGGKLHGKDKVDAFLREHPDIVDQIRDEVLIKMFEKQAEKKS